MKHPNLIVRSYTKTNSLGVETSVVLTQEGVARKLDVSKFSSVDEIRDWERAAFFAYGEEEASDDGIFTIGDMFGSEFEAKLEQRKRELSEPAPARPIEQLIPWMQSFTKTEDLEARKKLLTDFKKMYSKMELNATFGPLTTSEGGKLFNVMKSRNKANLPVELSFSKMVLSEATAEKVAKILKSLREM